MVNIVSNGSVLVYFSFPPKYLNNTLKVRVHLFYLILKKINGLKHLHLDKKLIKRAACKGVVKNRDH